MKVIKTKLPEVLLIEPDLFSDQRGHFMEVYHAHKLAGTGVPASFVQHNCTRSKKFVLRGLHAQIKHPQGKLIRVLSGQIFDVAIDIRKGSPRYGQWVGVILSDQPTKSIYIPPGFLHGFCVLSELADVDYHCTEFYDPSDEIGVRWDDPQLKIQWPISEPILSAKDQSYPTLVEQKDKLPTYL